MVQRLASRLGQGNMPGEGQQRPRFGMPEGARVLDTVPIARCELEGAKAQRRRYGPTLVLLVIAAIWLLAASRWIATDTIVPWDAKNQFYAFFRFLATAIHSGQAPFWNPYHYGGHPSVADPQSLIFSPPFVLWALFDPAPSIRAFDLIVYAHLAAGGLAVGVLGWRAGWPAAASILAAVIFMFGGPASGRLQHTGIILSYGLFPVALLLMQVALQRRSIAIAGAFGVVAAMLALGRNHEALLLCFVLAAALAAEIVAAEDKRRYLRERRGVLATMGIVAIALLAVPLLLTVQFAALSNRPEVPLDKALEASLYPANLASLAVANVLGSLETTQVYWGPNFDTLPEVGATDRSFNYLFVGAASTIVMLWFGIAGGWMARRGTRLMAAVLAVALLYALGRYTPVYALAFEYVPGVHLFRRPIDGTFVLVAAFALIAGQLLADYVREGIPRVARWRRRGRRPVRFGGGRLGRRVLGENPSRLGIAVGGSESGSPGDHPHRGAGAGAHAKRQGDGCGLRRGDGDGRAHLVQRGLEPERRGSGLLLGAAAAGRRRRAGPLRAGARDSGPAPGGREAAHRGRGRQRLMAEPRHGARPGGDQRLQSAADRLL